MKALLHMSYNVSSPTFSPNGLYVAFLKVDSGTSELWLVRVDGRQATQVSAEGEKASLPAFSPSGRFIAYVAMSQSHSRLMVMDLVGGKTFQVSGSTDVGSFGWSPDSTLMVFDDIATGELFVHDVRSELTEKVPVDGRCAFPIFGRNDSQIIFSKLDNNRYGIWSVNLDSGAKKRISIDTGNQIWPQMDPQRNSVLYIVFDVTGTHFYVSDADGEWSRQIFQSPATFILSTGGQYTPPYVEPAIDATSLPKWSPDGRSLLFVVNDSINTTNLYIAILNVTVRNEFLQGDPFNPVEYQIDLYAPFDKAQGRMMEPSWSPDGRGLVACAMADSRRTLVLLQIEPGSVKPPIGYSSPNP